MAAPNLLVHQDYSDSLRTARILWHADRVSFFNPGDSWVDPAMMIDGGSSAMRNPLLVRVFRQAGYAEQAGYGIPAIVRAWRDATRVPPEIRNDPGGKTYELVLSWSRLDVPRNEGWWTKLGVSVDAEGAPGCSPSRASGTWSSTSCSA